MTSTNARLEELGRSAADAPGPERNCSVFIMKNVLYICRLLFISVPAHFIFLSDLNTL
jgi:hypothetical protein